MMGGKGNKGKEEEMKRGQRERGMRERKGNKGRESEMKGGKGK